MQKILFTVIVMILASVYGCSDNAEQYMPPEPEGPVIKAEPQFGEAPLDVSFKVEGPRSIINSDATYQWDFDDNGQTDEGMTAEHTFETPGTYVVTLTVTDPAGDRDVTSMIIIAN